MISFLCSPNYELLDTLFTGITALSILIGLITIRWSRKQSHFNAVLACNDMFRRIVRKQQNLRGRRLAKREILFRDHLGLVSEEIFYMKQGVLPSSVAYSWLADMPRRIPVYDAPGKTLLNADLLKEGENSILFVEDRKSFERIAADFGHLKRRFCIETDVQFCAACWDEQRFRFAREMYLSIRGSRRERLINRFKPSWKSWKEREC